MNMNMGNDGFQANNRDVSPPPSSTLMGGEAQGTSGLNGAVAFSPVAAHPDVPAPQQENFKPYHPQGLDGGFVGKNDQETIDRLSSALTDLQGKVQATKAPEKLEDYGDFTGVELPETIKTYVQDLTRDPLFQSAAVAAQKHGVSRAAMQEIVTHVYTSAAENGLLEPPLDVEVERLALLPAGYENQTKAAQDGAIDARLQANVDFMQLMVKNGKIDGSTAEHALGMLMDTAAGNKFLEFVRQATSGGGLSQPFGVAPASSGVNSQAALRDALARVEAKRGTVEWDPTEHEAIMARYKSLYGD